MEALAATSLAGTIVQLIDFGFKLTASSVQVYNSADEATSSNSELKNVTNDMKAVARKLNDKLEDRKEGKGSLSEDETAEERLAEECLSVISELEVALDQIIWVQAGKKIKSKWRSFRQALLSVWHKE